MKYEQMTKVAAFIVVFGIVLGFYEQSNMIFLCSLFAGFLVYLESLRGHTGYAPVEDTESPVDWAQIVLARSNNYLIVDTETTGVDALGEVLEIAIIDLTGRVLMEQHFRPESMEEIPEVARSLTGLTMADLQDKPAFHEVYSRIVEMTKGKTILAYNAEFDQRLLLQTCLKYDLAPLANSWDCVMLKYSEYVGEWSEYHGNFQYQKLPTEKKGALEGCLACLDVVQKMAGGMRVS